MNQTRPAIPMPKTTSPMVRSQRNVCIWEVPRNSAERAYHMPWSTLARVCKTPIGSNENDQRWVLVIDDVTEAREVQLRAQTQDRLAAIGQLAAGIAHDFNNLLAVIVLHTEMGLLQHEIPPRLREYLDIILKQAVRAGDLVQQVLDFSRRAVLEHQNAQRAQDWADK